MSKCGSYEHCSPSRCDCYTTGDRRTFDSKGAAVEHANMIARTTGNIIAVERTPTYKFRKYRGVQYVAPWNPAPEHFARCGHCGRAWDDTKSTDITPTPAARCPFEYWHK